MQRKMEEKYINKKCLHEYQMEKSKDLYWSFY